MKSFPSLDLALFSLFWMSLGALAQATNRHVFLCFGQSNMEGFPGIEEQDKGPADGRFRMLAAVDFPKHEPKRGNWYPAIPPLCHPSAGLCPADHFGRTLLSRLPPHVRISVINVSIGGCKIGLFEKDSCPKCRANLEQLCPNSVFTDNLPDKHGTAPVTYGGYSSSIVVDERFVLRVSAQSVIIVRRADPGDSRRSPCRELGNRFPSCNT